MEEERLVKKAAGGDDAAFEELANAYQPKIYAVCFRVLKSEEDAGDACQEALIKIYMNIGKFRFSSRFSTWIYTVSKNTALDILRKKKNTVSLEDFKNSGFEIPDAENEPDSEAEKNELKSRVKAMINSLSDEHRKCIILKDVDGYSIEEICEILKLPEGTVKSRLHRGRERLKAMILSEGIEL